MRTYPVRLLAVAGFSAALFIVGSRPDRATADPPEKPATTPAVIWPKIPPQPPAAPAVAEAADVRAKLAQLAGELPPADASLKDVLDQLHNQFGIAARLDVAEFKRLQFPFDGEGGAGAAEAEAVLRLYDQKVRIPITRGMTVGDLLSDVVAQLPRQIGYRIRGDQVLIGPAYVPPAITGGCTGGDSLACGQPRVEQNVIVEQVAGVPVSVTVEDVPLTEVLGKLRRLTGANIVLDARCKEKAREPVSGTFDDARLFTVLAVLSDMCGLKTAYTNNVYYVTSPENAERVQRAFFRDLYGDPTPPLVPPAARSAPASETPPK